jgi:hypothetical protein
VSKRKNDCSALQKEVKEGNQYGGMGCHAFVGSLFEKEGGTSRSLERSLVNR